MINSNTSFKSLSTPRSYYPYMMTYMYMLVISEIMVLYGPVYSCTQFKIVNMPVVL